MTASLPFLLAGAAFGLSAGLSPGPLLTLVITETLRHGIRNGVKVALAPLITDLPIVCGALFLLCQLADIRPLLGVVSFSGALFLCYLGWEGVRFAGVEPCDAPAPPRSMQRGVLANFLNPSPYLFWITIGGPMMVKAHGYGLAPAAGFVAAFYVLLVGSKVLLAVMVGRSRKWLGSSRYITVVRLLGLVMWLFAIMFVWDALKFAGIANPPTDG